MTDATPIDRYVDQHLEQNLAELSRYVAQFQDWSNRIMTLLRVHMIRLVDGSVWIVQMEHPVDKKVHAFIAQPNP